MDKLTSFIKKDAVMLISLLFAVISAFFVKPSTDYLNYIDFKTLTLLFCLMAVMAGFNSLGLFNILAEKLLNKTGTVRGVTLVLVLLCFFSSMIITNDVSLITFVPFTIVTFNMAGIKGKLIYAVSLETVAANLGSMVTPIGNPQNLYIFSAYNMDLSGFLLTILPYALVSLSLLIMMSLFAGNQKIKTGSQSDTIQLDIKLTILYTILFAASILGVMKIVHYVVLLSLTVIITVVFDKKTVLNVDYSLLLTFIFLFIFIGNLGNIPAVNQWLSNVVNGNEVITGIAVSQIFSNVPAAILLSGFTKNAYELLIGVNLGGLGTLIASMASLISFKFIQGEDVKTSKYIMVFTAVNIIFLAFNIILWLIMTH